MTAKQDSAYKAKQAPNLATVQPSKQPATPYHIELTLYYYCMLGALQGAQELATETLSTAPNFDGAQGSAQIQLYKQATRDCFERLKHSARRVLPTASHPAADPSQPVAPPTPGMVWLEPFPDQLLNVTELPPSALKNISLPILVSLQLLPYRQRAVLVLRDVLGWQVAQIADVLETTDAAVNNALGRARVNMVKHHPAALPGTGPIANYNGHLSIPGEALLTQYVQAWEIADLQMLTSLLSTEVVLMMPPSLSWYQGPEAISVFLRQTIFTGGASGLWRLHPTSANGQPAFGLYRLAAGTHTYHPFAIQVLGWRDSKITQITTFLHPVLFPQFDLPARLNN